MPTSRWYGLLVEPERGESFVTLNGLRPEWRVFAYSASGLASILEQSPADVPGYVTTNPPGRRDRLAEESRTRSMNDSWSC